jgi:hypothetical protein
MSRVLACCREEFQVSLQGDGVSKKRGPGQRTAAAVRAEQQRRLAAEAARREAHAKLVAERHGDPRFIQRSIENGSTVISWDAGTPMDEELRAGLESQRRAFRDKFGREPGPDDPLLFDPDCDEPRPLSPEAWDTALSDLAGNVAQTAVDPAFIHAWREVGYIVTEDNQHTFSATEVVAYEEAVQRHRGERSADNEDSELSTGDGTDFDELISFLADGLEQVVAAVVRDRDGMPAIRLVESLTVRDAESDEPGLATSLTLSTLMKWLVGARERGIDPVTALDWVRTEIGAEPADASEQISGMIGHPDGPQLTVNEALDRLGEAFLPAMLWLCAGVVAATAGGDAHWLRQFDTAD